MVSESRLAEKAGGGRILKMWVVVLFAALLQLRLSLALVVPSFQLRAPMPLCYQSRPAGRRTLLTPCTTSRRQVEPTRPEPAVPFSRVLLTTLLMLRLQ
mmetsp:Transcript_152584/g.280944  ORF Transcript_152584/g.280944 Transcript_152584/m.280944 type:complete len:99 (+) Transcript_152584:1852-2148(+)